MKRDFVTIVILAAIVIALAICTGTVRFTSPPQSTAQAQALPVTLASHIHRLADNATYTVTSIPQLSVARIAQILTAYHSPFADQAQTIYTLGQTYQISSDYALAFWWHEDAEGTTGEARVTFNPGNVRCLKHFACVDDFAQFSNWREGVKQWYLLIRNGYVLGQVTDAIVGHSCSTVDQIVNVYDHPTASDYATSIKFALDGWRSGKVVL